MQYDFDQHIDRVNTDCLKYDVMYSQIKRTDVKPLWVADMDFKTPPFIIETIKRRLDQQILGYTYPSARFYQSIITWLKKRYDVCLSEQDIHFVGGVVPAIHHAICALTEKGDKVLIQTPVYHPFHHILENNKRNKIESSLKIVDGRFEMDFEDLEKQLPGCKVMILCNPHNPGGTIWKTAELVRLAKLCKKHGVTVISDEIHSDMTHKGFRHVPFIKTCQEAQDITITLNAPSKTFNMPGIQASYYYIVNPSLRDRIYNYIDLSDVALGNLFAYDCIAACYSPEGAQWLDQMLDYVKTSITWVEDFLAANCPLIKPMHTEASFLMFLDNREMPFKTQEELNSFYVNEAKLYLNEGAMFGSDGKLFMRLNTALPRKELQQCMQQLKQAYTKIGA